MLRSRTAVLCVTAVALLAAAAPAANATPADTAYALSNGRLLSFDPTAPATTLRASDPVSGIGAGESLVAIAVRPQNGVLYALGVNAAANTGTLYVIGLNTRNAAPVGSVGSIALTTDGATAVDLPASGYSMSFNPTADRLRVTTTDSLNFRINPNTGTPIDGDNGGGATTGTNPDGALHGVSATAGGLGYTNAHINATATTAYTLDATNDELALLNPPNSGTQTGALPLIAHGASFDAGSVAGFALDPDATTATSNTAASSGDAYAALKVGAAINLYKIALTSGEVTEVGALGDGTTPIQGIAIPRGAQTGSYPAIGLDSATFNQLDRFQTDNPGTQTTQAVSGLSGSEHVVGVSWRTQTGQLIGVGIDAGTDTGTVYKIDPQTGAATAIGAPGSLSWVDAGGTIIDLPASGWGVDVAPVTDTVRIVNGPIGLNARASLASGTPIDGNLGGAGGSVPGVNPDHTFTGQPAGATGPTSVTYASPWPHTPLGTGAEASYWLEPGSNSVLTTTAADTGAFSPGDARALVVGTTPLDFGPVTAADIPWGKSAVNHDGVVIAGLVVAGAPGLYGLNPETGTTWVLGALPTALRGIAVGAAEPTTHYPPAVCTCGPPPPHDTNNPPVVTPVRPIAFVPDRIAPTIKGLKVSAKVKRRLTVTFTASEAGKATIKLIRETRRGKRTVRKTYKSVRKTITKAGRVTITFKNLRAGLRLRVEVKMKDNAGNAGRTVAKTATVRRR